MARKKGSYEYKEDAEEMVYTCVDFMPKTTHMITGEVRQKFFDKASDQTIKRVLASLQAKGKIKGFNVGKIMQWQR